MLSRQGWAGIFVYIARASAVINGTALGGEIAKKLVFASSRYNNSRNYVMKQTWNT